VLVEEDFDEVRAGEFDEEPIETYWSWERQHSEIERLPHGESLDDARLRYAAGLRRLLSRTEPVTLLVIHELALHHIALGATASDVRISLPSFANALPYLFDGQAMERAAKHIERSALSQRRAAADSDVVLGG
jgi:broad specificity phosphatase PhoE